MKQEVANVLLPYSLELVMLSKLIGERAASALCRWTIFLTLVHGIILIIIWYLFFGRRGIPMPIGTVEISPFTPVSRWWDILLFPCILVVVSLFLIALKMYEKDCEPDMFTVSIKYHQDKTEHRYPILTFIFLLSIGAAFIALAFGVIISFATGIVEGFTPLVYTLPFVPLTLILTTILRRAVLRREWFANFMSYMNADDKQ